MTTATQTPTRTRRIGGLVATGLLGALGAMLATSAFAGLARVLGVDFEIPDGGETIPISGVAVVTGFFSVLGIALAAALLLWSARPADHFVRTAIALTAISLVPPFLSGGNVGTTLALVVLHLVAAAVMIPTLSRSLRNRTA